LESLKNVLGRQSSWNGLAAHFSLTLGLLYSLLGGLQADEVRKFSFPCPKDLRRADIYQAETVVKPQAILVLCPGCNGNGEVLVRQPEWRTFASENNLALLGLSFASPESLLVEGRGYYYASQGSGEVLLRALDRIFGRRLPLLLYGFSGGAHFVSRFVEWKPASVLAWCAYSAGWWDTPVPLISSPPGLVACGEEDGGRYGATFSYFLQGRALGKPWAWVSLPSTGHVISHRLEGLVRDYFTVLLHAAASTANPATPSACWCDNDSKLRVTDDCVKRQPTLVSWFPNEEFAAKWRLVHAP
jgi:hypothetical protein